MNVLVVDDYPTMVRIVRGFMKELGFDNVDAASDGETALSMARSKKYGLILSDWNMQPVTGIEFLRSLRADSQNKSTPFIMITAESKAENVVAARNSGANQYIIKPFKLAVLKQKLSAVLGDLA